MKRLNRSGPDGARITISTGSPFATAGNQPHYLVNVVQDITERKRAEERIAHMAHHDPLTDLPNRTAFHDSLLAAVARARADGESFAVMCIDLDRFKEVNDVFGHAAGDGLLCEIAKRLQAVCGSAFLARLGGDEFTIICTGGTQPAAAEALADRLLHALESDIEAVGQILRAGMSIGVAVYPNDGETAEVLLANADAALYRAKAEARGSVRFFAAEMDKHLRERRALQHDLRVALARGEMALHYQPQASIAGEIIGFEALARWKHPTRGFVSPSQFIPLAEDSGLIIPLGEWILRQACREAASWLKPLQIAVNLSPVQFRHGDLPALVHNVLLETGLAPGRLEIEITEGVLIDDFTRAVSILRRLKALGVRIAMDDFGTGYSSLSYLQSFPFDKIKIDQAFVANLERNPQSAAIIRAVIGLGRGLDLPVVAEGVETAAQLDFLTHEACNEVQGYFIGRPAPIDRYAELIGRAPPVAGDGGLGLTGLISRKSAVITGFTNAIDQRIAQKRLFHDRNLCGGRARIQGRARLADDEDRRRREAAIAQRRNRFQSAQAGHLLIDYETIAVVEVTGAQQRCAAAVDANPETLQLQGEFQRIAHRRIVVDNGNNRTGARQCGLSRHRCVAALFGSS